MWVSWSELYNIPLWRGVRGLSLFHLCFLYQFILLALPVPCCISSCFFLFCSNLSFSKLILAWRIIPIWSSSSTHFPVSQKTRGFQRLGWSQINLLAVHLRLCIEGWQNHSFDQALSHLGSSEVVSPGSTCGWLVHQPQKSGSLPVFFHGIFPIRDQVYHPHDGFPWDDAGRFTRIFSLILMVNVGKSIHGSYVNCCKTLFFHCITRDSKKTCRVDTSLFLAENSRDSSIMWRGFGGSWSSDAFSTSVQPTGGETVSLTCHSHSRIRSPKTEGRFQFR